ncbi:hypothetical protein JQK15_13620 [Sphingobium sp. BHU LFT2]|uniref:phage tail assembly chaperone n=1 Tax=Sphingobium sp. BHU LFT2 TaxID=2807634 RepID=UPI001BECF0E0|nr:hypothetical protein [Sphingobium sp. BHU LFT2]MBT2244578.1 hypothetical protein [Sphingobium sp. BHU LFT2]
MEWQELHANHLATLRAQAEDGLLPAIRILDTEPKLGPDTEFWFNAFKTLETERAVGFGDGPIPFTAILAFARYYGLSEFETDFLITFIRSLDVWVREQQAKNQARKSKTK